MPNIGLWEVLIIVLVIVLLFGAKKLPELARSVGRSTRIFKSEMKEMKKESDAPPTTPTSDKQEFWDRPENQPRQIEQSSMPPQDMPSAHPEHELNPDQHDPKNK